MDQQVEQVSVTRTSTAITWISRFMAGVAAIFLGVMMMVAVVDVCGRYFFNSPLEGAFELGGIFLVIAGTWGMGYCQLSKSNIRIDVVIGRFPRRVRAGFNIFAYLFCIVSTGILTWRSAVMTEEYMFIERGGLTHTLLIPYWPFMLAMAIGFAWLTVIFIVDLVRSIMEVAKR